MANHGNSGSITLFTKEPIISDISDHFGLFAILERNPVV